MNPSITILYFASLGESLGVSEELFQLERTDTTIDDVKAELSQRGSQWQQQLSSPSLQCALNQKVADSTIRLTAGDELAFFPPVTGG